MDYEYMDDGNSFTIDSTNFPETSVNAILES